MHLHDEDMIKDFSEDIDTLLTFVRTAHSCFANRSLISSQAGLFSAALTALQLPTIAQLQTDNAQITVQLLSLLAFGDGAPPELLPLLKPTSTLLPHSLSFRAPPTAVAVNALWFLSLVLSLSSALFGMVVKQWCCEYLKWRSTLTTAPANILLRQMRYDAWRAALSWSVVW